MISQSKWRPIKRSSMLSIWVRSLYMEAVGGKYAPLLLYPPEPPSLSCHRVGVANFGAQARGDIGDRHRHGLRERRTCLK